MFQREDPVTVYVCPMCGAEMSPERDLLRCVEHGPFFAYGPRLLVRAPSNGLRSAEVQMPWESNGARTSS